MPFTIKEYLIYNEEEILNLYDRVGWSNYTSNPSMLKAILSEYKDVYQKVLMTDNTERTVQFYKSVGLMMDTDMNCRAFFKVY